MKFDKKMTIGNILTIISMVGSLFLMWNSLDRSVAVIQERTTTIITRVDRLENMLFKNNQFTYNEGRQNEKTTN